MSKIVDSLFALLGVIIGGAITFATQSIHQINIENLKDKRSKHIAYNKFLLLEGKKSPLIHKIHHNQTNDFEWNTYATGTRTILYDNLHLLDNTIVKQVLEIDQIAEEAEVMGPDQIHIDRIFHLYSNIKNSIKVDYNKDLK